MLPDILEVARRHKLTVNEKTAHKEEVLCKCPFCLEDAKPGKNRKFYLSLNTRDQVFKCWFCGESGGVFRFMALLEGVTEEKVRSRYRKRKLIHPAERLTKTQLKLLADAFHYAPRLPDFQRMKQRDQAYYLRTLDLIWNDWQAFLDLERRGAFQTLVHGILNFSYSDAVSRIRKREKEIGAPLLKDVLDIYSRAKRPEWTKSAEKFVLEINRKKENA